MYVIASSPLPRTVRLTTGVCNFPPGYFSHAQNFVSENDIRELLQFHLERLNKWYEVFGSRFSVLIALASNDIEKSYAVIEGLREKFLELPFRIEVKYRENYGRSFGSYHDVVNNLKPMASAFVLTEDDVVLTPTESVRKFLLEETHDQKVSPVKFLAMIGRGRSRRNIFRVHSHGGIGALVIERPNSRRDLEVPLSDSINVANLSQEQSILNDEIYFDKRLLDVGARISEVPRSEKSYLFAYDEMRGIENPRYLSFWQGVCYFSKKVFAKCSP